MSVANNKKILIIEDDPGILNSVSMILEMEGFKPETATKENEIYKKVENFSPDLILLDVLMSGIDGRIVCKKIKADDKTKRIPVIMLSAHPSAKNNISEYGANDFLEKPFEIKDLITKIKKHLS